MTWLSLQATKVYHNQPYDESLEVHDSEDVASLSTSSPVPATAVAARPANVAPTTHKAAEGSQLLVHVNIRLGVETPILKLELMFFFKYHCN